MCDVGWWHFLPLIFPSVYIVTLWITGYSSPKSFMPAMHVISIVRLYSWIKKHFSKVAPIWSNLQTNISASIFLCFSVTMAAHLLWLKGSDFFSRASRFKRRNRVRSLRYNCCFVTLKWASGGDLGIWLGCLLAFTCGNIPDTLNRKGAMGHTRGILYPPL